MAQKTISRHFLLAVIFLFLLVSSSFASSTWLSSIKGATDDVPTRIAIDKEGNLYITQPRTKNNLLVYNRHGNLIRTLYGLNGPIGVAIGSDAKIYIGNDITDSVDVYNNDFSFSHSLGSGKGAVQTPNSIAISSSGLIYVTDTKAHNVKVYNPDGTAAFTFGSWGKGNGKFNFPLGLAIDGNTSEVYVTDLGIYTDPVNGATSGARVQVFDLNGVFKRSFGDYGTGAGKLTRPLGIAIDADSRIYVSDSYQAAVQVFNGNGAFLETIVNTSHPMKTPIGVAIGKDKRIFIASSNAPAIELYGLAGYTTMTTSPASLSFEAEEGGASPSLQDITITNSGEGTLNWTAVSDSSWLTLSQTAGSTDNITPTILSAGIQLAGLTAGTYSGSIKIAAESGAADTITVTLTVIAPPKILRIKPSSLSFKAQKGGSNPSSQAITIENAGQGEMNWTATADQPAWLAINTSSGIAPSTVSVNAASSLLEAGTYTGSITINAPGAQGSPASVNVSLRVIDAGTVKITTNLKEAGFDISGPVNYSGTGTEWTNDEVTPGDYTITFKHITGYIKPLTKTFKVQTGKETTIDGQYRTKPVATHIIAGSGGTKGKTVEVLTLTGEAVTAFEPFTGPVSIKVAAGDLDGSGTDKIIVTDHKKTIKVYTFEGTELAAKELAEGYTKTEIAVADIDNDGRAEIIVGVKNDSDQREIKLYKYTNGKLEETGTLYTENKDKEFTIGVGDINGDGTAEILIADNDGLRAFSTDLSADNKLKPIWTNAGTYQNVPNIAAGDINNDGTAEIALSTEIEGQEGGKGEKGKEGKTGIIKILKGTGEDYKTGDTALTIEAFKDLGYEKPSTVALGDLDGDGADEIIAGAGQDERNEGLIRLFENNGTFTNTTIKTTVSKFGVNVSLGRFR
ncbi:MAG: FG-GAP-like repeat-containing protein [Thermodesulfovibrionales bacterium]|nr:FG-GAP-like repeat-containing protein [Thermodesulfovibrionales bacterium]